MELIKEVAAFLVERKAGWKAPIIIVLLALGLIIVFAEGHTALAPFIYAVF